MNIADTFATAEAEDLWNRAPLMRLAYTAADGSPRVIPLGYLPGADRLVTWTIPTSVKVSSLQADPRVAVTIDVGGIPPCALLVRGTATVEPVDGIPDGYLEASRRTMDPAVYAQWEQGVRALYDSMTEITIMPTWARLLDFKTTMPQQVERLARAKGLAS